MASGSAEQAPVPVKTYADILRNHRKGQLDQPPLIPKSRQEPPPRLTASEKEKEKWNKIFDSYRSEAQKWWDQRKVFADKAKVASSKNMIYGDDGSKELQKKALMCWTKATEADDMACALLFKYRNKINLECYEICVDIRGLLRKHAVFFLKKYLYHCSHVPVIRSLKILTGIVVRADYEKAEVEFLKEVRNFFHSEEMSCPEMTENDGTLAFRFTFEGRKKFEFLKDPQFRDDLLSQMNASLAVGDVRANLVETLKFAIGILKKPPLSALIEADDISLLSRIVSFLKDLKEDVNESKENEQEKSDKNKKRNTKNIMDKNKELDLYRKSNELTLVSDYFFVQAKKLEDDVNAKLLMEQAMILKKMAVNESHLTSNDIFKKRNMDKEAVYNVVVDIHGFYENEADLFVKRQLYHCSNIPEMKLLTIITGKKDGHSVINIKVQEILANDKRKFKPDPINAGRLIFRFDRIKHFNFFTKDLNFRRVLSKEMVYPMWW